MTGVNGYSYARPAGSMASKGMQYGGAAGNISNQYSNVGNTGMSKADLRNSGMTASAQYRAEVGAQQTAEYSQQLSQMAQMYGISNFDPMMADTNNSGIISKKNIIIWKSSFKCMLCRICAPVPTGKAAQAVMYSEC